MVHAAKRRKATPAAMLMASVGRLTATTAPTRTDAACTTAVAIVIPTRMGSGG